MICLQDASCKDNAGSKRVGVVRKLGCSGLGASAGLRSVGHCSPIALRFGCGGELRLRWMAREGAQGLPRIMLGRMSASSSWISNKCRRRVIVLDCEVTWASTCDSRGLLASPTLQHFPTA